MKSNLIFKLTFFLIFFISFSNSYSEELKFEATSIEIIDKDKIIIAKEGVKILSGDEIVIDADKMRYDKEEKFLEASGNIYITNEIENILAIINKIIAQGSHVFYFSAFFRCRCWRERTVFWLPKQQTDRSIDRPTDRPALTSHVSN